MRDARRMDYSSRAATRSRAYTMINGWTDRTSPVCVCVFRFLGRVPYYSKQFSTLISSSFVQDVQLPVSSKRVRVISKDVA